MIKVSPLSYALRNCIIKPYLGQSTQEWTKAMNSDATKSQRPRCTR